MIIEFDVQDLNEIMKIWLDANVSAHSFVDKVYWQQAYGFVKSTLPSSDLFIWKEQNVIKGFIGITGDNYIAGLFVDEKYQSQGIGRELLNFCKQRYPRLELDVFVKNIGAVRFYTRNGFVIMDTKMNKEFNHEEYHMAWSSCVPIEIELIKAKQ